MKALILNSGRGKRMDKLTQSIHKSMITLSNGETVFERQVRVLSECGINEIYLVVGYKKDM